MEQKYERKRSWTCPLFSTTLLHFAGLNSIFAQLVRLIRSSRILLPSGTDRAVMRSSINARRLIATENKMTETSSLCQVESLQVERCRFVKPLWNMKLFSVHGSSLWGVVVRPSHRTARSPSLTTLGGSRQPETPGTPPFWTEESMSPLSNMKVDNLFARIPRMVFASTLRSELVQNDYSRWSFPPLG